MLLELNLNPDRHQLRNFGLGGFVVFAALGTVLILRTSQAGWIALGCGIALGILAIGCPRLLRIPFQIISVITFPISFVVSTIVLAAIFFLIFTPIGIVWRLFGVDPLQRAFDEKAQSYFVPRRKREKTDYFKQY